MGAGRKHVPPCLDTYSRIEVISLNLVANPFFSACSDVCLSRVFDLKPNSPIPFQSMGRICCKYVYNFMCDANLSVWVDCSRRSGSFAFRLGGPFAPCAVVMRIAEQRCIPRRLNRVSIAGKLATNTPVFEVELACLCSDAHMMTRQFD